ncbi:hypothetical protein [Thalassoroseus pseudoceratinae]|uniref:hypothetical protein n=1 Tax=Thalassoroseus pseudoceratinae TaxID=2713176 RepID=UPI001420C066|nr:hypothetical protein [Thalassoroseus pseudoceratinae]
MLRALGLCLVFVLTETPIGFAFDDPALVPGSAVVEHVGFGSENLFKVGRWTPITVRLETTRACEVTLVVESPDPDGNLTILPSEPIPLDRDGEHVLTTRFRPGRLDTPLTVRVELSRDSEASESVVAKSLGGTLPALEQSEFLVGVVGGPWQFTEDAGSPPIRYIPLISEDAAAPPEQSDLYESLDAILIVSESQDLGEKPTAAIAEWVRHGGHLCVAIGEESDAFRNSPLGKILASDDPSSGVLPTFETTQIRDLQGLESYTSKQSPLEVRRPFPIGVRFDSPEDHSETGGGRTVVSALSGPLVIQVPMGFGLVTAIGTDLNRAPLADWKPLPFLMRKLFVGISDESSAAAGGTGRLASTGITDLASQIHATQADFPSITRGSLWAILGLMLLYLLIVGPLDYFLVHRVLKRPQLTWITLPMWILAATVFAVWLAGVDNGSELLTNQLDLIDIDGDTNAVRTQSWCTVYSPEARRYRLSAEPMEWAGSGSKATTNGTRLSWSAAPENAFGGLYRQAGVRAGQPSYHFADSATGLEDYPILLWSTGSFAAEWHAENAAESSPLVESELVHIGGGRLQGSFTHHLPVAIEDWLLAYDRRVYRQIVDRNTGEIAPLSPDRSWPASAAVWSQVSQRDLTGFLTGEVTVTETDRTTGQTDFRQDRSLYRPLDKPHPQAEAEILRVMTFFSQLGGAKYTSLQNSSLRQLDLTDLLHNNRAILFGRVKTPATEFQIDDHTPKQARQETFVRIVLPVRQGKQ